MKLLGFSLRWTRPTRCCNAIGQLPYQQAHSLVEMIMVQGHEQALAIIERQRGAQNEDPQASAAAAA